MLTDEQRAVLEPLIEAYQPAAKMPSQEPAPNDQCDRVAAPEQGKVASGASRAGAAVEGSAVLHPLVQARQAV